MFADDTSVVIETKDINDFETRLNAVLKIMINWFKANKLSLNLDKTNVIKFLTYRAGNNITHVEHDGRFLENVISTKFLGLHIDKHLNWKEHIEHITPKLSSACYAIRSLSAINCLNTLKSVYFAYFHSLMRYGVIFWGNSVDSKYIFILQKKTIRIMAGVNKRNSCRNLFRDYQILTLPCEYIYSLMAFYFKNRDKFTSNVQIHDINTRRRHDLHMPSASLTCFQKGVYFECIKIFNSLPKEIKSLTSNAKAFKTALRKYLYVKAFYSIDEFISDSS